MDEVNRIDKESGLASLKEALKDKTLVGEFVGHPKHQHLVTYPIVGLYFFGLTDHSKKFTSIDPCISSNVIKTFKLKGVRIDSLGTFETYPALLKALTAHYIDMAQGTINCEEEGVVLYFVQRGKLHGNDFTLSLSKSKTMEYNVYRILREILRELCTEQRVSKKVIKPHKPPTAERFYTEVESMVKTWFGPLLAEKSSERCLPKPLWYYKLLGEKVFQYIGKLPTKEDIRRIVKEKFAEFIETFTNSLDTDVLLNYLQKHSGKCTVIITPPFLLGKTKMAQEAATLQDIMWEKDAGKEIIHLVNVPRIQIEWKKHQEMLNRHHFIVYNEWNNFEEYKTRIEEAKKGGNEEEEKIKQYECYQKQKLYKESVKNIKFLETAQAAGYTNIRFTNKIEDCC